MYMMPIQKCRRGKDVKTLSDTELLAIILGTGSREKNVMELSLKLYHQFNGLSGLYCAGIRELEKENGIGFNKSIRIIAALEFGKRFIFSENEEVMLDSPIKVWKRMLSFSIGQKQEEFFVFILNNKNVLLKEINISKGTISETVVHPREIFREAIKESASTIIVAHNHPSGITDPSKEDIHLTKRIEKSGKLLGIKLLDHVIIGSATYFSFKEEGYL